MIVVLMMADASLLGGTLRGGDAGAAGAPPTRAAVGKAGLVPVGSKNLGPAASSTPLSLNVVLSPRDPAALDAFLQQVYDPSSPRYHRFLARGAFGADFGASKTTIARISSTLRSEGLNPGTVDPNDLIIPVQTTVSAAESAFNVRIDSYQLPSGRRVHANTTPPQVLSSIASDLVDVAGLSDVAQLQPSERQSATRAGTPVQSQAQLVPDSSDPSPCSAASSVSGSYTANQLAHAYGFDTGAYDQGQLGAGQTIALFELEPFSSSDIGTYQTCYGISTNDTMVNVKVKSVDGGAGSGSGSGEAALDIEDVTGLAPAASIDVYEAPNTDTGVLDEYAQIADDDSAQVVSTSWGLCEKSEGMSSANSEEADFEQMAAQGQSMLAATGDDGSEGCGTDSLAVDDPASDPYVTGVGGTTLGSIGPPPTETVWDESSRHAGAGGGGISAFWRMPSWQTTIGVNADSSAKSCAAPAGSYCREVPDVSASADPYDGYTIYYKNDWQTIGGTSGATPLWGALVTLTDEGCSASAGFLNPSLYAHESDLNDITSGDNDYTGTNGGLYPATTGYNMASGLGTPTAALFAPGVLCPAPTLVVSTEPPSSVPADSSFPVAVSVENSLGNVLTNDDTTLVSLGITSGTGTYGATLNCAGGNSATVISGVATFSCSINDPGPGYTLTAGASALGTVVSSSFAVSTGTVPVLTTQPRSQTFSSGGTLTFTAAASGTPTPTVQWQYSTNAGSTWTNLAGTTSTSLTVSSLTSFENGWEVRAVFTNVAGSATSNAATMTLTGAPVLTTQPRSQTFSSGGTLTFTAAASGTPTPTVQWQYSTNAGSTWTNLAGATSTSLTVSSLTSFENGWEVRAVFTNVAGSATSNAATMTLTGAPVLTTQPRSQTFSSGGTLTFTAAASGTPTPTVQWQYSTNAGGTWTNLAGATSTSLTVSSLTSFENGWEVRAVFTNVAGSATSNAATMTYS